MKMFFEDAKNIYAALADDQSREIYGDMVSFNLTGDEYFVLRHLDERLTQYGIDINAVLQARKKQPKIIWGAGQWGQRLVSLYPGGWTCFGDNHIPESKKVCGLSVLSLDEIRAKYPNAFIVIAVRKHSGAIREQLLSEGIAENNIWMLGKLLDDVAGKLERAQYFDLPILAHDEDEVFVDVGGFDGMTSRFFMDWANHRYQHIYVFEANPMFYDRCKKTLADATCTVIPKGLWSENGQLSFYESPHDSEYNVTLHEHNSFDEANENLEDWIKHTIDVVRLDDTIPDERVTFIKMDIEGSEANALMGAENIIRKHKPKLAICVYHRRDDLWTIPALILRFRPDYKLYLRHYSFSWGETVLYAV